MARCGIKPDMLTYSALVCIILFVIFIQRYPYIAGLLLVLNVLLDNLDGSLARYLKIESDRGNFLDHFFDYLAFIVVLLTLIGMNLTNGLLGALYLANYLVMQGLVLYGNFKNIPLTVLLRTKFFFYTLVLIWIITGVNFFDIFMLAGSGLAFLTNLYLFYQIRWHS